MPFSLEHHDACIPITGLKALAMNDARLVLQAQGNHTRLIDEKSGRQLAKLLTFKRYNIHGLLVLEQKQQDERVEYVQVLAWGEYSLKIIDLLYVEQGPYGHSEASLNAASAEYLARDWMLAGCTDESGNAYLVTAHNAILGLCAIGSGSVEYRLTIYLRQLATSVTSMLYSADAVSLSASHILITAGTVFGEIIVWSCFVDGIQSSSSAVSSIHHFFTGHEGSIFGVTISPEICLLHGDKSGRLLSSCSDDRTIRVWDISDCERMSRDDPSAYSTDGFELRSTGFTAAGSKNLEVGSERCLAKAFGHVSRIWGVRFLPMWKGCRQLSLLSYGEDATCLLWNLSWEVASHEDQFQLHQVSFFHSHSGKNIFSIDTYGDGSTAVAHTGGADGAIKTLRLDEAEMHGVVSETEPTCNGSETPAQEWGSLRAYAFVSRDSFIATSTRGEVVLGRVDLQSQAVSVVTPRLYKETLCTEAEVRSFSTLTGLPDRGLALLGNSQGLIRLYNHRRKSLSAITQVDGRLLAIFGADPGVDVASSAMPDTVSFITAHVDTDRASLMKVSLSEAAEPQVERVDMDLPRRFEVNCASLICGSRYLALGSRHGALTVYRVEDTIRPLKPLIFRGGVHGDHGFCGVNSITPFWSSTSNHGTLEYFMTCGRDGHYCVHKMEAVKGAVESAHLRTLHRSPSQLGQIIEGAYFDKQSGDLILYGFRSRSFILWNESTQSELANIDCGGSRRYWAFHPGDIHTGGVLLWNKTGTLNASHLRADISRPLRAGAHGREIKSVEVFNAADSEHTVFVTGSEDTTVRIFRPSQTPPENAWDSFKCLRVLKHETTIQQVGFSKSGNYLFVSGGLEMFFVWRLQTVPVFGATAVLIASSPKDTANSDLRVTSFDVLDVEKRGSQESFIFCLTYSNSTIKIFHFSSGPETGNFTLLARGKYTSNCLTQARFIPQNSTINLITTSTDGHFTLWNLTSILEPFYLLSPTLSPKQPFETTTITPENIACENRYQMHSNSIKSLEVARVSATMSLVVSGGDDNALTISLLDVNTEKETSTSVPTISIPDAHAASVTAVKILEQRPLRAGGETSTTRFVVASSGNDHRVKMWTVDVHLKGSERIAVRNVVDQYSSVADISSLDVIYGDDSKLLVCGVGLELLSVQPRLNERPP